MGRSWFRLREETEWTARECETRRIGIIPVEEAKPINANDAFYSEDLRLAA
jgi:hypothetical protein